MIIIIIIIIKKMSPILVCELRYYYCKKKALYLSVMMLPSFHFKRWKTDAHQTMKIATTLFNDIRTLLLTGPLHFSKPKHCEAEEYKKGVSSNFQNILIGIEWIKDCLTENLPRLVLFLSFITIIPRSG